MSNNVVIGDFGNSIIKAKSAGREIAFRHALYQLTDAEFEKIVKHARGTVPDGYARVNGIPYAFGEVAEGKGTAIRRSGAARYEKEYYGALVAITLAHLYQRSGDLFFFGSHAPRDVEYADDLIKAAIGRYHVELGTNALDFRVMGGSTFDEPVGGLMNLVLKDNGQEYARGELAGGDTLVIDIGGLTTDMISVKDGQVDYRIMLSEPLGINEVEKRFVSSLRSSYRDDFKSSNNLPAPRVRKAISEGVYHGGGRPYPCEEEARESANILLNRISDLYQDQAGGAQVWDNIVLTGGGSAMLYDRLVRNILNHDRVLLADPDSESMHLANVRGGLKLWRFYEAEGIV